MGPHGADEAALPLWFINRTNEPSLKLGSHAGDPGLRAAVNEAHCLLRYGGPLHSAPLNGSRSTSNKGADCSECMAPRLSPWRYSFGRLPFGSCVQYS